MNSFKILISMLVVIYLLPGVFGNAGPSLNFPNDDPCFCDVFNQNPYFVSQIEETFKMSNRIRRFEITSINPHESSECKILVYVKNKMRFFPFTSTNMTAASCLSIRSTLKPIIHLKN